MYVCMYVRMYVCMHMFPCLCSLQVNDAPEDDGWEEIKRQLHYHLENAYIHNMTLLIYLFHTRQYIFKSSFG